MIQQTFKTYITIFTAVFIIASCGSSVKVAQKNENRNVPATYNNVADTSNSAMLRWKEFFKDSNLIVLIDSALSRNQELNIMLQEINIAKNDIKARKGAYLPYVDLGGGIGVEKVGRYTSKGASDATNQVAPGIKFPEPLADFYATPRLNWEIDIWKKLRNSRKMAINKYLSSIEGRRYMVTNLISEIADSYYDLQVLDLQLDIIRQNIDIQTNALELIKIEKNSAKVTELAVKKFEAEVLKNKSLQYALLQQVRIAENRINFLVGRFPQPVVRTKMAMDSFAIDSIHAGVPSQLLSNRPDIRQSEYELMAAKLDVKIARAEFYPNVRITAGTGFQAFNPSYLLKTPESLLYSIAGDIAGPLINRNAIKANLMSANARQIQAAYKYEQTLLNAFIEVSNQLSNIDNLKNSYDLKSKQVDALNSSIEISILLFKSARADYMEVLMTQRDALESKMEMVELKKQLLNANINLYKALGGGTR